MISEAYIYDLIDPNVGNEQSHYDEYVKFLQSNLDPLIHEPKRLTILLVLTKNPIITFTALQKILDTSSGNLTSHLKHLTKNDLVHISKIFIDTRPNTIVAITDVGKEKLKEYYLLFKKTFDVFNL
ncbi:MAG: transcriptional regulator [Candidatus Hodarchaeales archaeon]|jgi:DNA-binding MarR family transcriptional regulator